MKKLTHLLLALLVAVSLSAFTPQRNIVDTYYYEDDNGNVQTYEGLACPNPTTPCCKITINGRIWRIYFDITLTLPVPGPNCN